MKVLLRWFRVNMLAYGEYEGEGNDSVLLDSLNSPFTVCRTSKRHSWDRVG